MADIEAIEGRIEQLLKDSQTPKSPDAVLSELGKSSEERKCVQEGIWKLLTRNRLELTGDWKLKVNPNVAQPA